jgi:hypothetical protein
MNLSFEDMLALAGVTIHPVGYEGSKNMIKVSSKKRFAKTVIYFRIDTRLVDLINTLKEFYKYTTKNELLPYLLILSMLDIATLKSDKEWSKEQKKAYEKAKKFASDFGQAVMLATAKTILSKQSPKRKITIAELADKTRGKLQCQVQT